MIEFNSVVNVPQNVQTTVLSITNAGVIRYLRQIGVEGTTDALWQVFINMQEVLNRRTTAVEDSFQFDMYSHVVNVGDIIDVKVTHCKTNLQEFSSEIIITDTPDENININIDVNFEDKLSGITRSENNFIGKVNTEYFLLGSVKNNSHYVGKIKDLSNYYGSVDLEDNFIGIVSCEDV